MKHGYTFISSLYQENQFEEAIFDLKPDDYIFDQEVFGTVFTFTKCDKRDGKELKVQIIVASTTPMQCILSFHSSRFLIHYLALIYAELSF